MLGIVAHGAKDLRIEPVPDDALGPHDVQVKIEVGGICGSDLHYYNHGGSGAIRIREPMVLGHEVAGTVVATGTEVSQVRANTRVAVNPSRACGQCRFCQEGLHNHCLDMRFLGSAMRMPHIQGGFREMLVVREDQAVPIADTVSMSEAAMAEPLAVCLHAVNRAGPIAGKRVLVTGCGPIGALTIMAARFAGARSVTAVDVQAFALASARTAGADLVLNTAEQPTALAEAVSRDGFFDVMFEASGAGPVLSAMMPHLRPCATVVQLGLGGDIPLPVNVVVTRELDIRGTFRFDTEYRLAVDLINARRIDVTPLLTATLPFGEAEDAFRFASDKSRASKVQLSFA